MPEEAEGAKTLDPMSHACPVKKLSFTAARNATPG
jgi:hypothetical protein